MVTITIGEKSSEKCTFGRFPSLIVLQEERLVADVHPLERGMQAALIGEQMSRNDELVQHSPTTIKLMRTP